MKNNNKMRLIRLILLGVLGVSCAGKDPIATASSSRENVVKCGCDTDCVSQPQESREKLKPEDELYTYLLAKYRTIFNLQDDVKKLEKFREVYKLFDAPKHAFYRNRSKKLTTLFQFMLVNYSKCICSNPEKQYDLDIVSDLQRLVPLFRDADIRNQSLKLVCEACHQLKVFINSYILSNDECINFLAFNLGSELTCCPDWLDMKYILYPEAIISSFHILIQSGYACSLIAFRDKVIGKYRSCYGHTKKACPLSGHKLSDVSKELILADLIQTNVDKKLLIKILDDFDIDPSLLTIKKLINKRSWFQGFTRVEITLSPELAAEDSFEHIDMSDEDCERHIDIPCLFYCLLASSDQKSMKEKIECIEALWTYYSNTLRSEQEVKTFLNAPFGEGNMNALCYACSPLNRYADMKETYIILKKLIDLGADINTVCGNEKEGFFTPYDVAYSQQDIPILQHLLKLGYDPTESIGSCRKAKRQFANIPQPHDSEKK